MANREQLVGRITKFPGELESLLAKIGEKSYDKKVVNWTVRIVVHHLADSHLNSYIRIKMALTEENPTVKPYDESAWARLADVQQKIDVSLKILQGIHSRIVAVLMSMGGDDWNRQLYHPEIGAMNLEQYIIRFAEHGEGHLEKMKLATKK